MARGCAAKGAPGFYRKVRSSMATTSPTPLLWSPTEAAKRLGIGRATVYELLTTGQLASLKIGARRLIPDSEVRRFIDARLADSAEW
jgi:excisionase family DNA binding protein